ncbi:MAG: heme biosynthesis protein HemY [Bauldia sp.]|nr:heme biosynthesis protein HemY [Bauldia sp.]
MVRVLVYVALIFLLAAGFAWLAERPGEIAVTWLGYEIRTSLMVAAIVTAAVLALFAALWTLIRALIHTPRAAHGYFAARRRDKGYHALSQGMIALGAGDEGGASKQAAEARRLLPGEPLALLLSAQAAQLRGDHNAAREAFEGMAAGPETKLLGLHGLFVEAQRQGKHEAARHYAEEAARARPQLAWAGTALFEYQSASGEWDEALKTLADNTQAGLVDKTRSQRLQAVLQTARAMELEAGEPEKARSAALEAHRLAPELVPASVLASRLSARLGDVRRAARVIETTWKLFPHAELAEAYAAVRPGDSNVERMKRIRRLADLRPNNAEASFALARAAIDARDWAEARQAIEWLIRDRPSERACLLMAEIEDGDGDRGRVRDWLARAVRAPRDPTWVADGQVFEAWAPVSPVSGKLDAFEWKVPAERLGPPTGVSIDVRPFQAEAIAAEPVTELVAESPRATAPPAEAGVLAASATAAEAARSVAVEAEPVRGNGNHAEPAGPDAKPRANGAAAPANGDKNFPAAPDDPGPRERTSEPPAAAKRKFWVF